MKIIVENCIIILAVSFLIFIGLDYYNQKMDFVGNSVSIKMLIAFCVLSIGNSIYILMKHNKKK